MQSLLVAFSRRAVPARHLSAAFLAGRRTLATKVDDLRIVRFLSEDGQEYFGTFTDVTEAHCRIAQPDQTTGKMTLTDETKAVDIILAPVEPPAIYCVGLNYADHAAEVKMDTPKYPVVFMKSVTSVTGHNNAIVIPGVARDPPEVDYEAELAVIIGREGKNIPAAKAMDYVMGYTILNDVTARRWQGKRGGGQWARSKSFDTFCPMGPFLVPRAAIPDPHNLTIRTTLNGDLVQDSNTNQMLVKIPQLIEFISQGTTLLPGTVISTGTPAGVGYVKERYLTKGDTVSITIQGLGTLRNIVAHELEGGFTEF